MNLCISSHLFELLPTFGLGMKKSNCGRAEQLVVHFQCEKRISRYDISETSSVRLAIILDLLYDCCFIIGAVRKKK
jgi:hypothetical protein